MDIRTSERKTRINLIIIALAVVCSSTLLFFYTPNLQYFSSIVTTLGFCLFTMVFIYMYISPLLMKRVSVLFFLVVLVISVSVISTVYLCLFEFGIIHYPDVVHPEMIPMRLKISFFTSQGIFLFFLSRFIFLFINTFQLTSQRYDNLINGYTKEINEVRMVTNPYFLSQSLRKLQDLLVHDDFDKAHQYNTEMSALLNKQLTYSLSEHISLEKDLDWLNHYLDTLQQFSNEQFEYHIEIEDPDIVLQRIPPLLLQPIIETFFSGKLSGSDQHIIDISIRNPDIPDASGVKILFTDTSQADYPVTFENTFAFLNLRKRISLINEVNKFTITLTKATASNQCIYTLNVIENNFRNHERLQL